MKLLVGTPTKVDTVKVDPVCPFRAAPADNEMDDNRYFCSEQCPASCKASDFQPIIHVTTTFRVDFDGARKCPSTCHSLSLSMLFLALRIPLAQTSEIITSMKL